MKWSLANFTYFWYKFQSVCYVLMVLTVDLVKVVAFERYIKFLKSIIFNGMLFWKILEKILTTFTSFVFSKYIADFQDFQNFQVKKIVFFRSICPKFTFGNFLANEIRFRQTYVFLVQILKYVLCFHGTCSWFAWSGSILALPQVFDINKF